MPITIESSRILLRFAVATKLTGTVVATFALTVLLAFASDAGTLLGLWNGPVFLLRDHGFSDVFVLSRLFLPVSIFVGVVSVVKRLQSGT